MLHFEELRISPDGKKLIIDASVDKGECYNSVNLDSIVIDTQDTYVPTGPSKNPIYSYSVPTDPTLDRQHVRLVLEEKDLGGIMEGMLFFVYIISSGQAVSPCDSESSQIMGTVANLYPYY
jgi:hypothetical protein|nr:MAG TPA: hypothetical protein [Crassvirales sp.]